MCETKIAKESPFEGIRLWNIFVAEYQSFGCYNLPPPSLNTMQQAAFNLSFSQDQILTDIQSTGKMHDDVSSVLWSNCFSSILLNIAEVSVV